MVVIDTDGGLAGDGVDDAVKLMQWVYFLAGGMLSLSPSDELEEPEDIGTQLISSFLFCQSW